MSVGLVFSFSIFLNIISTFLLMVFAPHFYGDYTQTILTSTLVHIFSVLLPTLFFLLITKPSKSSLRLKKTSWRNVILSFFIAFCAIPLINIANLISLIIIKSLTGKVLMPTMPAAQSVTELLIGLTCIALYPAFSEELLFRGIIQTSAESRFKSSNAILFTAFLFGLNHFSIQVFTGIFLLGIIFSKITLRSGSLLPAIIIHFINNAVSTIQNYFLDSSSEISIPTINHLVDRLIKNPVKFANTLAPYFMLIIFCLVLLLVFYKLIKPDSYPNESEPFHKKSGILAYVPGIVIILIMYTVELLSLSGVLN